MIFAMSPLGRSGDVDPGLLCFASPFIGSTTQAALLCIHGYPGQLIFPFFLLALFTDPPCFLLRTPRRPSTDQVHRCFIREDDFLQFLYYNLVVILKKEEVLLKSESI
jgi:hypothetical protein